MMNSSKKSRRWLWIVGGLVVIALIVYIGLGRLRDNAVAQTDVNTGDIVTAFVGDLSASATASGQIVAQREASLMLSTSGEVAELFVSVGDTVQMGDPLLRLEMTVLERAVASAEQNVLVQEASLAALLADPTVANVTASEAAVASAEANLADLLAGPSADEIASSEASLRAAEADVAAAASRVSSARANATQDEIQAAEIALELAQATATQAAEQHSTILVLDNEYISEEQLADMEMSARTAAVQANADLAAAQEAYNLLVNGDSNAIASAQAGWSLAVANRDAAQARHDLLLLGASETQIANAEATLAQAEASLATLLRGPSDAQITTTEVQLEQARIALERAQNDLAEATLYAPFVGVVTAVNVSIGEIANGVVIEMVDNDSLEVVLNVDEVDIGSLTVTQPAIITLETWPTIEIPSEITAIAPQATQDGTALVTYEVHLSLSQTELPILVGMTANANLITANRENVLLVPNAAINADRTAGTYSVNLVQRDSEGGIITEEVEVTIGLRYNAYTQIVTGLEDGDELMVGNNLPVFDFTQGPPPDDGPGG